MIQVTVSELLRIADHLEPKDRELVRKAYERAAVAHHGQRRLSGEEYVNHPLEVAAILADLQLDAQTLAAALLHDTVEDTPLTAEEVETEFGPEVAAKNARCFSSSCTTRSSISSSWPRNAFVKLL